MESTIETFLASLKDPLELHRTKHHVFPSYYVEYLSSLWMPFKPGKSLVLLCSRVMWSPLSKHFQLHWRIHLCFTMLSTMCFEFILLNIYHLYECHLKGRAIMHQAMCFLSDMYICMAPEVPLATRIVCTPFGRWKLLLPPERAIGSILHTRRETFCQGWLAGNWLMSDHLQQVFSRV